MSSYQLFNAFAHRYDLHTPPDHYKHDHQLVLDLAREIGPRCRILDVGCGTGTLLAKAHAAGFDVAGLDASEQMIAVARQRLPPGAVRVQRMQDLDDHERYDLIVSLSWSIHYCSGEEEMTDILRRMRAALLPGGKVLLQVAHAPNVHAGWMEDDEPGPDGTPRDVVLRYRFDSDPRDSTRLNAEYVYTCRSRGEHFAERHVLETADVTCVVNVSRTAGFTHLATWESWRRDAFANSGSPLIVLVKI